MKTKALLLFLTLLLLPLFLFSQKIAVRGVLADTSGTPLEAATVMLLNPADSALIQFTRTQTAGSFEFKNLAPGNYLLRGSYLGYKNMQRPFYADGATATIDLGVLRLETAYNLLGEVQISGDANPVTIKNDTIEYNAGSFKVRENAVVEDLLKKLPGIEVEPDGTVKAQGKEVQSVLVDGKRFFGDDPKIATQNLPADAVDKVQVFDKKSEQATFSGVDDGQREKTINLELKEDKKDGWFGNATAGTGIPDTRYSGRLNLNRFTPKQQLSFLGMGNNINQAGFSIDDYMAYTGAMRQLMGGGGSFRFVFNSDDMSVPLDMGDNQGFLGTWAGGVNFNQDYGSKHSGKLNTSYMYSRADKTYDRNQDRQTFLPEGAIRSQEQSYQNTLRDNHRVDFTLDQSIDSTNSLQLSGNFAFSQTQNQGRSTAFNSSAGGILQNDGFQNAESDQTGMNGNAKFLWRHKFAKKGRNVSITANTNLSSSRSNGISFADNGFYRPDGSLSFRDTIHQDKNSRNDVLGLGGRINYNEPLGKRRYLELSYQYNRAENRADKEVFDLDGSERNFNNLLSNAYTNTYAYQRGGAGLRINRKTWNGSASIDLQYAVLEGVVNAGQGQPVRQDFSRLLPRLDFNYDFSGNTHFRMAYNANLNPPTVQQLQPVPDLSDPLNILEGNPNLRPEYEHQFDANYFSYDPTSMRSFFVSMYGTYTDDKIVNAQSVDSLFVRHYQPVNVRSDYRVFADVGFGIPVKKLHSRFNLRTDGGLNRGYNFINNTENQTTGFTLNQSINWEFEPVERFQLFAGAEIGYTSSAYSIDADFNQSYFTFRYNADADLDLPANFHLNSSLQVVQNNGLAEGYNEPIPIWSAGVSKFFLKNKRLEINLSVHDILNRNLGITRNAGPSFVEDERVASLGRYGMLRVTYALNSMGAAGGGVRFQVTRRN